MPNWCEGSLKVRGTKENMTRFILEWDMLHGMLLIFVT